MRQMKIIGLGLLSGLLTSAAWSQWCSGLILLISFLPLLHLDRLLFQWRGLFKARAAFVYSLPGFLLWNLISIFWIRKATVPGALFAVAYSALLMALTFWLIQAVRRNLGHRLGNVAWVTLWIAFEHFFMHAELSFPWLMLGNGLAKDIQFIQWYEFTGHYGGTLWILILNILLYQLLHHSVMHRKIPAGRTLVYLLLLVFPMVWSVVRFRNYEPEGRDVEMVLVQPNIDPYEEKFGGMSFSEQLERFLQLADSMTTENTLYVVGPETAIDVQMREDDMEQYRYTRMIRSFLQKHPQATVVIGATTHRLYPAGIEEPPTPTARLMSHSGRYYDVFNTALQIDTTDLIQFYHKSQLVVGVEKMPFPRLLRFLGRMMVQLGGTTGSYGIQEKRTPLEHARLPIKVGTAICYESIFGDYYADYVREGANLTLIITNDGWWGNTAGYQQHLHYASLRAIETRRSIGRSANTGISCFVNPKGELLQKTPWWEPAVIRGTVRINQEETFYTRFGDYIPRISDFIAALLVLYALSAFLMNRKKSQ